MALSLRAILIAGSAGIFSHHAYFIRGEHLTNIPSLLLVAIASFFGAAVVLSFGTATTLASSGSLLGSLYTAYLTGL